MDEPPGRVEDKEVVEEVEGPGVPSSKREEPAIHFDEHRAAARGGSNPSGEGGEVGPEQMHRVEGE